MKSNTWRETTLGELADFINGDRGKNYPGVADRVDVGIPFINTGHILPSGRLTQDDMDYITSEKYNQLGSGKVRPGDIVYCLRGSTIGKTARNHYEEGAIASSLVIVRAKPEVNQDYLYYFLTSPAGQQLAKSNDNGSAQPNLSAKTLSKYPLLVPSFEEQQSIVNTLNAIDNKIEVNTKLNQTLEEMAQAIFKSWFVDFDPVKAKMNGVQPEGMDAATVSLFPEKLVESELGLIPEGWKVGDLSDLIDFNPKRTLKKGTVAPYLDMKNMPTSGHLALDIYDREMGSGTKFMNGDSLLARITPCLENGKTAYVDFLEDEQVGWGSTEYIVMRSKSDSYKYFSYYMARFEPFRKFAMQSMTGTSGRQRAQAQTVQTMPFVIPPLSILEKFDKLIAANMKLIKRHGDENKTLAELRDTLLPKLLSGEIELGQTQELIEVE